MQEIQAEQIQSHHVKGINRFNRYRWITSKNEQTEQKTLDHIKD